MMYEIETRRVALERSIPWHQKEFWLLLACIERTASQSLHVIPCP